jgi:arylformamidase
VNNWIDVSVPVRHGMIHWPGDPPYQIHHMLDQKKGDLCTVSRISTGVHAGTHMDAPRHFIEDGATIDEMPLDATVGRARVIGIRDRKSIRLEELREHRIEAGERILFKTANSDNLWTKSEFDVDFIFIARDAAAYLAQAGIRAVGIDYLSVGGFTEDAVETHQALLGAGVWIIEGLNLSGVEPGAYELICLPIKLIGSDGAPARALLRSIE